MRLIVALHQEVPSALLHPVVSFWGVHRKCLLRDLKLSALIVLYCFHLQRHLHLRRALLILELGSLRVLALVSLFFIPHIREQKDFLLLALLPLGFDSVTAVLSLLPGLALRYAATPLAVSPPDLLL